jgi:hypothetical protein
MEYLFRGLRSDGKGWVYGDLMGGSLIFPQTNKSITDQGVDINDFLGVEVLPSTVGMWTGLTDKNKVKVFGGDRVIDNMGRIFIVIYHKKYLSFIFEYEKNRTQKKTYEEFIKCQLPIKVLGNIHTGGEDEK